MRRYDFGMVAEVSQRKSEAKYYGSPLVAYVAALLIRCCEIAGQKNVVSSKDWPITFAHSGSKL
jgi:hypothetical protein